MSPAARPGRAWMVAPDGSGRQGYAGSTELAEDCASTSGPRWGPIAKPEDVKFVDKLPKTRSGKIMRRVLKARAQGLPEGDISTLEE